MLRIALAPGEKASDVKLRIAPEGIISGRVVDENGEPARNVSVYALRPTYMQGVRSLISAGITTNSTNDLGEYRIFGLTPGRYYVRAQALRSSPAAAGLATSADRIYPEVYYPGAPDLETAAKVEVRAGAEAGNTNFKLRPARAASIRGRVVDGATGQATERAYVMASPTGAGVSGMSSLASANTKGEFEIDGLLPGSYTLTATGVSASWTLSARDTVTVGDSGLTGVLLRLTAGATLAGTLRADDALAAAGLDLSKLRVQLLRLESGPPMFFSGGPIGASPAQAAAALPGAVDAQGNFVLEGVSAFRNQVIVSGLPAPCYLKSASLENRETIDTGLEAAGMGRYRLDVVVSGDGAQFDGLVLDRQDKPAVQAMVTLVPADPASRPPRLYRSTDTDQNGQFTLKAIPPGRYLIYAWQDVEDGAWFDPEFMARYEKLGESVSFDPQEHKTLNLKLLSTSEDPSH